jgi:two-component system, cell cycle response regulator
MKILSIDDSKMVHMVIARALKNYEIEHLTAFNGQDGLLMAEKEQPALIILDITMPVMTGLEALEKFQENPAIKHIPIIMLTAEGGVESMDRAFELGIAKYLTKPFTEDVLIGCLTTVVSLQPKAA